MLNAYIYNDVKSFDHRADAYCQGGKQHIIQGELLEYLEYTGHAGNAICFKRTQEPLPVVKEFSGNWG